MMASVEVCFLRHYDAPLCRMHSLPMHIISNMQPYQGCLSPPRPALSPYSMRATGDIIEGNLLANCVRESGDHGAYGIICC